MKLPYIGFRTGCTIHIRIPFHPLRVDPKKKKPWKIPCLMGHESEDILDVKNYHIKVGYRSIT